MSLLNKYLKNIYIKWAYNKCSEIQQTPCTINIIGQRFATTCEIQRESQVVLDIFWVNDTKSAFEKW